MKILITGAAGMLGSSLVPVLHDNDHTVFATDIRHTDGVVQFLDVRDIDEMLRISSETRPDILVHLAAETDLETCETRVDYAYQENYLGTQNACVVCRQLSIPLVYVSTAGVFDGTKDSPYTEFDRPNPINVYGASKLEGEHIVRDTVSEHYIVRAGWMVGGGERDKKFVSKVIKQLETGKKKIYAVTDRRGSPTYAPSFSTVLERLLGSGLFGTYHLTCKGQATRYEVAARMLEILGRKDVELVPVTSDFFRKEYFARRPPSEEMRNYVLELRSMDDMPHWTQALETYLKTYFKEHMHE